MHMGARIDQHGYLFDGVIRGHDKGIRTIFLRQSGNNDTDGYRCERLCELRLAVNSVVNK